MGERSELVISTRSKSQHKPSSQALEPLLVETPGGRIEVRWDYEANATPQAQLAFFAEFLHSTGVYEAWIESCPLHYSSPNAPQVGDVLGTWLLSILAGHRRYAHVTTLRGDRVSEQILGMQKILSEDALRRALARMSSTESENWLQAQLLSSVDAVLDRGWILDIDSTVKPLYGKQEGAEVGYNPHKPGRPSHVLHTYWVSYLRLVLDVVVSGGKQHSSKHALPGLSALLDKLGEGQRPALVRGDCGFGNEAVLAELELRSQPYLFKLRQTAGVKRMLARWFRREEDWTEAGPSDQGWSAAEDRLRLAGWSRERRVVLLRRRARSTVALTHKANDGEIELLLPDENDVQVWEYAVLVTSCEYPLESMAQLYRDRADAENGFDELKNQWGWGGFTTQDLNRCQTSARAVALVYNWWSWYCRAAKPEARMEAITSRALLLAGVGRATKHAGKTTLYLTPIHAARDALMLLIANIQTALKYVRAVAEQFPAADRWKTLLNYIVTKIIPPVTAKMLASGAGYA
jgi:hypothetical protein